VRGSEREGGYNNKGKMGGGSGRGRGSERENKEFPCHYGIQQSVYHMGWGREREEIKISKCKRGTRL
jgi:hypothetical protein